MAHRHHHKKDEKDEDVGMGDIGKDPSEFSICSLDQVPLDDLVKEEKPKNKKKERDSKQEDSSVSHRRVDLAQKLRDEFRQMQQQRKENRITHLVLGKGFGEEAVDTLRNGYYIPTKVLEDVSEEERKLWESIDFKPKEKEKPPVQSPLSGSRRGSHASSRHAPSSSRSKSETDKRTGASSSNMGDSLSCMDAFDEAKNPLSVLSDSEEEVIPIMEKFRCTYKPVKAILETRMEIGENIRTAENELEAVCFPFTYSELFETMSIALIAIEKGKLHEKVSLPMYVRETPSPDPKVRQEQLNREAQDPLYLEGAPAVLEWVRQNVLPKAYEVVPVTYNVQWMLQYSVAFLKSIAAQNKEEAEIRVELLARCVRLLASTENFSAVALSIESKAEEYDAFELLRTGAESHVGQLLDDVEAALTSVHSYPFPQRRQQLSLVDRGIHAKLRQTLLFLNEIDYSWIPTVYFQMKWKLDFLSSAFRRVHGRITMMYADASLGFIDQCLYDLVKDSRVTGKISSGTVMQVKVPRALQVEYDRVTSRLRFQMIAISLKGSGSRIVGLQLCMGARYILRQSTPEFDDLWGFPMNEPPVKETDEAEKQSIISSFYERVRTQMALDEAQRAASATEENRLHAAVDKALQEALDSSSTSSFDV